MMKIVFNSRPAAKSKFIFYNLESRQNSYYYFISMGFRKDCYFWRRFYLFIFSYHSEEEVLSIFNSEETNLPRVFVELADI